ncbi:uncharacterized protein [Asterias amurensis]
MRIKDLVADVTMEYEIPRHRLRRASTLGIIRDDVRLSSLARQEIIIESNCTEESEEDADKRLSVLNEIISSERGYCNLLQTIFTTYKEPLRKSPSMPKSDHNRIFSNVKQMVTTSATFLTELEEVARSWNPNTSTIGQLITEEFLEEYSNYYSQFRVMRLLLLFLRNNNRDFIHLCNEKRGTSWHTLESLLLLPVQRVSQYDKYLSEYYNHTPPSHPDYSDVCQATRSIRSMVKDREEEVTVVENETRLQQVQDRFPHDDLQLIDRDAKSQRFKILANRRRSAPSTALRTAFTGSKKLGGGTPSSSDLQSLAENNAQNNNNRVYVMEGPIQMTGGVQVQSRYVFLFNDVVIIAKPNKSCTTFRLKQRIRVSELWLASCIDDVIEINKQPDRSFVIGWPTTNCVWTFTSAEEKEIWWQSLKKNITAQREHEEPRTVNIKVLNSEPQSTGSVHSKTLQVSSTDTADDMLRTCLQQFHLDSAVPEEYGLWVQSGKDSGQYPLIGHEIPYAIKMSHLNEALSKNNNYGDLLPGEDDGMASAAIDESALKQFKCQFFLRRKGNSQLGISVDTLAFPSSKRLKKQRKTHFKLSFKKSTGKGDTADVLSPPPSPNSKLFGIPLPVLCPEGNLPKTIIDLLTTLYHNGPYTPGIFRKSANARITRELKAKLSAGEPVAFDEVPVPVCAALLKDFMRNIPNSIMYNVVYENWVNTNNVELDEERINSIKSILSDIPSSNQTLLRHLFCIMYHINERSEENNMNSYNQAVCCSPSMLWAPNSSDSMAQVQATEKVPQIVQFMVDNVQQIFGDDVIDVFGGPPMKFAEPKRRDSGDSDSLQGSVETGGMKRDDSSLDSIDREMFSNEGWPSSLPVMSQSTLSRDSGLTSSDNQLYPESDTTDTTDSGVDAKDKSGRSSSPGFPTPPGLKHTRSASSVEKGDGDYIDSRYMQSKMAHVRRVSEPNAGRTDIGKRYVLTKSQSATNSMDNSPDGSDNEVELSEETVKMIRELNEECSFKLLSGLLPDEESGPEGEEYLKVLDKRRHDYLMSQKNQQSESAKPSPGLVPPTTGNSVHSSPSSPTDKSSPTQKPKQRRISMPAKFYNPLTVFHKKATPNKRNTPSTSSSEALSSSSSERIYPTHGVAVHEPRGKLMDHQNERNRSRSGGSASPSVSHQRSRRPRISSTRQPGKLSPGPHRRGVTYPETTSPPREFFPRDATHLSLPRSENTDTPRGLQEHKSVGVPRSLSDDQLTSLSDDKMRDSSNISKTPSPRNSSPVSDSPRQSSPPSYQETMHRRARLQRQTRSLDQPGVPVFERDDSIPRRRKSGALSCSVSRSQPVCRLPSSPYSTSPPKSSPIMESGGIIFHISDSESSDNETVDVESLRLFSSTLSSSMQSKPSSIQVRRSSSDRSRRAEGRTESFTNAMTNNVQRTLSDKRKSSTDKAPQTPLFYGQEATLTSPRILPSSNTPRMNTVRSKPQFSRSKSMDEDNLRWKAARINSVDSAISTGSEMSPSNNRSSTNFSFPSTTEQGLSPKAKSTMQDYFLSADPVNGMVTCKETEQAVTKSRQDWRYIAAKAKRHSVGFLDELDNVEFTEESYV